MVPYLQILRPAQRYDDFKLIRITCQAACHGKTEHGIFVKFKQTSKTAVVLLAGGTISGTPCPRHFTVPLGAEAPSGHVAQVWAIPPPSWGLLSQWHRQETTTPRQTEHPPPEPRNILKRFCALYDDKIHYYMKKVSKSCSLFKRLLPYVPILGTSDFS